MQDSSFSSSILLTRLLIFNFKPSGGSVTIFNEFYSKPSGNVSLGPGVFVVSHSLKSSWVYLSGSAISATFTSSYSIKSNNKWQFYNSTQWPLAAPNST